jgi:hypothetical protein
VIRLLLLLLVLAAGSVALVRLVERRRRERLAQVRASFLVSVPAAREHGPDFKDVALRSGAVRLRLPRYWAEEYPDEDHASFRDPGNPRRVLRLAAMAVAAAPGDLRALLQARAGEQATTLDELPEGRWLLRSLDASREDGRDVFVFQWLCAAPLPPARARLGSFRLSVPEPAALDPLTRDVVAMLDCEIRSARLA